MTGGTGDPEDDGLGPSGAARVDAELDGFHQPTAMFDKGQFLGELADLVDGSPDTRAAVEAAELPPKGCRLIVVAGTDIGLEWAFKQPELVIGRDEDCELSISDISVSRRHAKIRLDGSAYVLEDLGSNNGTFVNGDRLSAPLLLSPGDEIALGERTFRFVELNEAPPTGAAHPVLPDDQPSQDLEQAPFERAGPSQIDLVAAVREASARADAPPVGPKSAIATASKWLLRAAVVLAGIGGLVGLGLHYGSAQRAAARAELAKTRFLQAVALVKAQRFGDAGRVLDHLAAVEPEHPRLADYRAHIAYELAQWERLERARALADRRRYQQAIDVLSELDPASAYAKEAGRRADAYRRKLAEELIEQARAALADNRPDEAARLVARALELDPGSTAARLVLDAIEGAGRSPPEPPRPAKRDDALPPVLVRAIGLYRQGQIPAALDAAEAAGSAEAEQLIERMKAMKSLLAQGERAHQAKAGQALLDLAPRGLALDDSIGGGQGVIRRRLVRWFADGLYLKGIEALQDKDEPRAFRLFSEALRKAPEHDLAKTRLAELEGRARALFSEARALESSDGERAKSLFERLTQMTEPSNTYHKLAKQALRGR